MRNQPQPKTDHYKETRQKVYDLVRKWERKDNWTPAVPYLRPLLGMPMPNGDNPEHISSHDAVLDDPVIREHFYALAGPYGKAYYQMLKAKSR